MQVCWNGCNGGSVQPELNNIVVNLCEKRLLMSDLSVIFTSTKIQQYVYAFRNTN